MPTIDDKTADRIAAGLRRLDALPLLAGRSLPQGRVILPTYLYAKITVNNDDGSYEAEEVQWDGGAWVTPTAGARQWDNSALPYVWSALGETWLEVDDIVRVFPLVEAGNTRIWVAVYVPLFELRTFVTRVRDNAGTLEVRTIDAYVVKPSDETAWYQQTTTDHDTLILLHANTDTPAWVDDSLYGHTVTAQDNAALDTGTKFLGAGSVVLDGNNDRLEVPSHADFGRGTGDFCVEAMVRFANLPSGGNSMAVWQMGNNSLAFSTSGGSYYLDCQIGGTVQSFTVTPSTGNWYYVAMRRTAGTAEAYFNGSSLGTWDASADSMTADNVGVGDVYGGAGTAAAFDGHIDELRFSAIARTLGQPAAEYTAD